MPDTEESYARSTDRPAKRDIPGVAPWEVAAQTVATISLVIGITSVALVALDLGWLFLLTLHCRPGTGVRPFLLSGFVALVAAVLGSPLSAIALGMSAILRSRRIAIVALVALCLCVGPFLLYRELAFDIIAARGLILDD